MFAFEQTYVMFLNKKRWNKGLISVNKYNKLHVFCQEIILPGMERDYILIFSQNLKSD